MPSTVGTRARVGCDDIFEQALRQYGAEIGEQCQGGWDETCQTSVGDYIAEAQETHREEKRRVANARAAQTRAIREARPIEEKIAEHVEAVEALRERHERGIATAQRRHEKLLTQAQKQGSSDPSRRDGPAA